MPSATSRPRATGIRRRKKQTLLALLTGPPAGRHRSGVPVWHRLIPAVIVFTAVGPAVASMVPDDRASPTSRIEAAAAEATTTTGAGDMDAAPTTDSTVRNAVPSEVTDELIEHRFALAASEAPGTGNGNPGQHQQTIETVTAEAEPDTPLVSPSKKIVVRVAPTTTTTTPPPSDRTDFWRSIIDSIGSSSTSTTTLPVTTTTTTTPLATTTTTLAATASPTTTTTTTPPPGSTTTTMTTPSVAAPEVRIVLNTQPAMAPTAIEFTSSFAPPFHLLDGQSFDSGPVAPGSHWVTIAVPPGWDGMASCASSDASPLDPAEFVVGNDDRITCSFHLVQRARIGVLTTEAGEAPSSVFSFEVRVGASLEEPGAAVASGSTDDSGSVLLRCLTGADIAACEDISTDPDTLEARFVPGDYQVCVTGNLPGWINDLDGFVPAEDDGSTECIEITLEAGAAVGLIVDNTPPPGGLGHQKEFWINWSSCGSGEDLQPVLDETLSSYQEGGTTVGGVFVDTCETAAALLETVALDGTERVSDPAYLLAAELLVATLNQQAGALTCDDSDVAIADAQTLLVDVGFDGAGWFLSGGDPSIAGLRNAALGYEQTLHEYNTNQLCERSEPDPTPGLLVPILIWPALWLAGRVGRHRRISALSKTGR